ncbi:MAG TPA: class I SAM-dependent methyltransferase [Rhizomicrobium sp.]|nr:class I SAM-dependent methyltransferase [Rhizomicrobium sp.]
MANEEAPDNSGSVSARRINRLAAIVGARSYLEIGVRRGGTFFHVQIAEKVAVDPKFQFDVGQRPPNERFFAMTSDEWFQQHSAGTTFDIIFIDGLHTFDQTLRDFCNSLFVSHPRTLWLIDDTMPSDMYAAWPDQVQAARTRRVDLGNHPEWPRSRAWQGDVFKVVFALHDFFPHISYRTLMSGKPQTLAWRQPRDRFEPVLNSMEAIARMSYFHFRFNEHILRKVQDEPAFDEITRSLAGTTAPEDVPEAITTVSNFEVSDPAAMYDLASRSEAATPSGGLEWSAPDRPPGIRIGNAGAIELIGAIAAPATIVLSGTGAKDPYEFFDMRLAFDGHRLIGRFEVGEAGNWSFVGMTKNGSIEEEAVCRLSVDHRSGLRFQDGLTIERISVFRPDHRPSARNGIAPAFTIVDTGYAADSKGWYCGDAAQNGGYCWMGPAGESLLHLKQSSSYRLVMPEVRALTEDLLRELRVTLGETPMTIRVDPYPGQASIFSIVGECAVPAAAGKELKLKISFPEDSVLSPHDLGLNEDRRRITIAARSFAVAAIG